MPLKQIDIMEVAHKIIGEEEFANLPMDDSISFLELLRLFYEDAKFHGESHITGCRENIINGWKEKAATFIEGKENVAIDVMNDFYDLVYERSAKHE